MASAVPRLLTLVLQIGIGLGILVAIAGIVLAVRSPAQSTPMRDRAVRRRYGIVVGLEFALLGVGAAVLAISGLAEWIPVLICAGVGIHFIPLSRVLGDRSLVILGVLISAVALAALITGLTSAVAPGTVTGAGARPVPARLRGDHPDRPAPLHRPDQVSDAPPRVKVRPPAHQPPARPGQLASQAPCAPS